MPGHRTHNMYSATALRMRHHSCYCVSVGLHVVPVGVSMIAMPLLASSTRMASEAAKSLALRASARACSKIQANKPHAATCPQTHVCGCGDSACRACTTVRFVHANSRHHVRVCAERACVVMVCACVCVCVCVCRRTCILACTSASVSPARVSARLFSSSNTRVRAAGVSSVCDGPCDPDCVGSRPSKPRVYSTEAAC